MIFSLVSPMPSYMLQETVVNYAVSETSPVLVVSYTRYLDNVLNRRIMHDNAYTKAECIGDIYYKDFRSLNYKSFLTVRNTANKASDNNYNDLMVDYLNEIRSKYKDSINILLINCFKKEDIEAIRSKCKMPFAICKLERAVITDNELYDADSMKGDVILKNDYYTYTTFKECNAQLEHNVKLKDDITSQIVIMRHRKTEEYRNKNTDKAPTDNSFREFLNNINF